MAEFKLGRIRFVWQGEWATATTYYKDDVVRLGGKTYICVVGHSAAADFYTDLDTVPSRWNQMTDGQQWRGDWTADTFYSINDVVKYGGLLYIANDSHTSAATATLGLEPNFSDWDIFAEGFDWKGNWAVSTRYKKNDLVKYGGYTYVCNAHHTSAATAADGLEIDAGNWDTFNQGIEYKGTWTTGTRYKVNDVVKNGGGLWICTIKHSASAEFATDLADWSQFVEGVEFEDVWDSVTIYQPGDIVVYGGNQYISKTVHSNSSPGAGDSSVNWTLFSEGFKFQYDWSSATTYKVGEVVRLRGYTYLCLTENTNHEPPNGTYWEKLTSGIQWQGTWTDDVLYKAGDAVRHGTNAYICILAHRAEGDDGSTIGPEGGGAANSRPDLDSSGTYWNLLSAGSETSVLTTRGDLVYFGGAGATRLPIGIEGQVLRAGAADPEWVSLGAADHVYYVAPHGTDSPAPVDGFTLDKPWKTIRYACEQVEKGCRNPNATRLLELNRAFIQREVTEWIDYQVTNTGGIWTGFDYDEYKCERDTGFLVDRLIWDLGHGGNLKMRAAAQAYVNALGDGPFSTEEEQPGTYTKLSTEGAKDVLAYNYMLTLIDKVLSNQAPTVNYQVANGDNSTSVVAQYIDTALATEAGVFATVTDLVGIVTTALTDQNADNIPERYVPSNVIMVKAGTYRETLPIIVPAETCILGDEVRAVHAGPAGSLIDATDAQYSIGSLTRLGDVVSDIILGTAVTATTGNTVEQDAQWPFASATEASSIAQLVRVMQYNIDFRLGTTHNVVMTDPTDYNTSYLPQYGNARTLIKANKTFVKEEIRAWITANYPELKYSQTACLRDVGYIVDAMAYDLTYGGNSQTVVAGLAYYEGVGSSFIVDGTEKTATLGAYVKLKQLLTSIAVNTVVTPLQTTVVQVTGTAGSAGSATFVGANMDELIDIVNNGPSAVTLTDPSTAWVTGSLTTAYSTLNSAAATIAANTITFIDTTYPTLVYNETKCSRDVGIILKAVGYDFMFNSNFQTLKSAYSYLRATATEVFSLGQKNATRAALEYVRTQAIASVGADATAIARINSSMQIIDDIIYSGSTEGSVCQTDIRAADHAVLQLERNREFIVAEISAWIADEYPAYTYNIAQCERDVGTYIDALKFDLKNPGNYKSLMAARYYANAVLGNTEEDMFYLRNGTGVRNMTLEGLSGDLTPVNEFGTSRVTAGAYASLDPGWGPDDFRTWITSRSPYVQNCCTFGNAAIGQKIDGALHAGGNKSIVSNDFTQLISDGIGAWVTNNGRAELVSVFTYYSHIGYLAENGGRIRGTNGNNSYGDWGSVAEGVDETEVPNTAIVDNKAFKAVVAVVNTDSDQMFNFEFSHAGSEYTNVEWLTVGPGNFGDVEADEFRDDAVFQVRMLDLVDDSTNAPETAGEFGGFGYITNSNTAQAGGSTSITLATTDGELSTAYIGMKVVITGGSGVGKYAIINTYDSGTKVAGVVKESTGAAGWDHFIPGYSSINPDASSTYTIEPAISFTGPSFAATASTLPTSGTWSAVRYGDTTATYSPVAGTYSGPVTGTGATFSVIRNGSKYIVSIVGAGTGYERLETIVIDGTSLGGATSTNDITITITSVNSTNGAIQAIDYDGYGVGGLYVAARSGSQVGATSINGADWTTRATLMPSGAAWNSIAHGILDDGSTATRNSYFVAVAGGSANTTGAYSTDGITWTATSMVTSATWVGAAFGEQRFVAISSDSTTARLSLDGINWDITGTLTSTGFTSIAYGKGLFVAIKSGSRLTNYSTDGVTWTEVTLGMPSVSAWNSITWGNGRFVAVSNTGSSTVAAYSLDGINWTAATLPTATWTTVTYGQGVFLAVSTTTQAATSEDGINWTSRTTSTAANGFAAVTFGNPNRYGRFVAVGGSSGDVAGYVRFGAKARGRAYVADNKVYQVLITEPGSGYASAPTMTITDPNNTYEAPFTVRTGKGAIANPSFKNRGTGYITSSAELDAGDGYADFFQEGSYVAVRQITARPVAGSNVIFENLPGTYKLVSIVTFVGQYDGDYTAFYQVSPPITTSQSPIHGDGVTTRIRYSQVRLTGHDFLNIGTGGFNETNYPGEPTNAPLQSTETIESGGGRVFFTSTDQDGNFRVGDLFTIEQSTGVATLNADAFNIAGLQELSLGEVTLGGGSATITEFSTDPFFTADSDTIIPTQRAIKAYIASQIGGGGASLIVNSVTSGSIVISTNQITTLTNEIIQMNATFDFRGPVTGMPLAFNYFLT